jgi:hypothetical protein
VLLKENIGDDIDKVRSDDIDNENQCHHYPYEKKCTVEGEKSY